MKIRVTITGHPVAKARARTVRTKCGRTVSYTPAKTRRWEQDARLEARTQMVGKSPLSGPLVLFVSAYLAPPQSWPAWKRQAALDGQVRPTGKPDLDNIVKAAKDAMNGILWIDDAQVARVVAEKAYCSLPRVEIIVDRLQAAPSQITKKGEIDDWI